MTDAGDEIEYDTGPELLQTEESRGFFLCQVQGQPGGKQSVFRRHVVAVAAAYGVRALPETRDHTRRSTSWWTS